MKKLALLLLAAILAISFVACAEEEKNSDTLKDYEAADTTCKIDTGTLTFGEIGADDASIVGYAGLATSHNVKIPEKIGERNVTSIGKEAFKACTAMSSIELPNTLTQIDSYAFVGCSNLESVVIPASVTSIGAFAFQGCTSLKTVVFAGTDVTVIGEFAFEGCSKLETVVLPEGLKTIERGAFYECSALKEVKAPSTLESIGVMAYYNCTSLSSVTLSASITEMGEFVFESKEGLDKISKNNISAPAGSYAEEYVNNIADDESADS